MEKPELMIDGKLYSFVKRRSHNPISIYKGSIDYLRIGQKDLILKEINYQKNLLKFGFPVPEIVSEGEYQNYYYFTELSLGDKHFSQIFKESLSGENVVSDLDFSKLLELVKRYTQAQLKTISTGKFMSDEFEKMIQYDVILKELPTLNDKIIEAMRKTEKHIENLPIVLTHGDFNPHNILERGVIDWERASYSPAGYDLATCISQISFFPISGDFEFTGGYRYSKDQIDSYWKEIDTLYTTNGLSRISDYADDFIFCRSIWSVVRMDRWPKFQQWRYSMFEQLVETYLDGNSLKDFLSKYNS